MTKHLSPIGMADSSIGTSHGQPAKLLGVSPGTLYNHIPDLRQLRESGHIKELTRDQRPSV
ncbi:hypothetical protein [Nonomuraea sp. NPDC003709]|uniref:hypothetical protein n=1 Tax=Nonomuraea sp. NPDC003709 TaxID=3154450 RepID=UPI0033AA99E0